VQISPGGQSTFCDASSSGEFDQGSQHPASDSTTGLTSNWIDGQREGAKEMSRSVFNRLLHRRTIALTAALAGCALPVMTQAAGLVINLQIGNGQTKQFIDPTKNSTDIPVYVYATVTGLNAVNDGGSGPPPANLAATTGNFQGVQYLYYNILNSGTHPISGVVGNGTVGAAPQLNATLGFNANGAAAGKVQNIAGGLSIGSTSSLPDIAFPRASHAVWDNASSGGNWLGNDGKQIVLSNANKTVSFLVETFYFRPSAFAQTNNTTFTVSVPNLLASTGWPGAGANWFQDNTALPANSTTPPQSTQNGAYTAGSSVTFTDTYLGDANDDGSVDVADLGSLATSYGATSGATWAQGDFNGDGAVGVGDLGSLATNYGNSLTGLPNSNGSIATSASLASEAGAVGAASATAAAAVPEPAFLGLFGLTGLALVGRRRRVACSCRIPSELSSSFL